VKDAMMELKKNGIDVNQLVKYRADHCKQAESSKEELVPTEDNGE
jgi:hypothetical protein